MVSKQIQYSFFIDESDLVGLRSEARKVGLNNVSSLMRLLVKQFLSSPIIDLNSIKHYNTKKE